MSGVQLAFGIVLTVVGLGLLPLSTRIGRYMNAERDRLQDGAPTVNKVFVDVNNGDSTRRLPIFCILLAFAGVVLVVTAFTAH